MIDTRDGKRYRTVSDGRSCWMADNLNYMIVGSRCYDGEVANCDIYGRLYNWKQAVGTWGTGTNLRIQGACPAGWHVPNENEWLNLGQASTDGKSWRSQRNLWVDASQADPHIYPYTKLANNASRFSALPAGGYFFSYNATPANGSTQLKRVTGYYDLGEKAWWWCSSWKEALYQQQYIGKCLDLYTLLYGCRLQQYGQSGTNGGQCKFYFLRSRAISRKQYVDFG